MTVQIDAHNVTFHRHVGFEVTDPDLLLVSGRPPRTRLHRPRTAAAPS